MLRTMAIPAASTRVSGLSLPAQRLRCRAGRVRAVTLRRVVRCTGSEESGDAAPVEGEAPKVVGRKKAGGKVNLFDPAATASRFLTRRFGLAGGLGLVAVLAAVEGGELLKAVVEDVQTKDVEGELVELPSGTTYKDLKLGGGNAINEGDFVGVQLRMTSGAVVVQDTKETGKLVAFIFGKAVDKYPGLQDGMQGMRRAGKREIVVPGQGQAAELKYTVEVVETSPAYFQ